MTLPLLVACGEYPVVQVEDGEDSFYETAQVVPSQLSTSPQNPPQQDQEMDVELSESHPSNSEQPTPTQEPPARSSSVNLQPIDLEALESDQRIIRPQPNEPEVPSSPELAVLPPVSVPTPLPEAPIVVEPPAVPPPAAPYYPTGKEQAAREHLVETALSAYENLEVGRKYPVRTGGTTLQLEVVYPKGTHDTISDYNSFMCSDYVLYSYTEAGYDLSEAGLGSRTTSGMLEAFRSNANGENISFTPQGGTTAPKVGDIAFLQGHISILTEVTDTSVIYTQFNARNHYSGKLTKQGNSYQLDISWGGKVLGWGFYYPR